MYVSIRGIVASVIVNGSYKSLLDWEISELELNRSAERGLNGRKAGLGTLLSLRVL